MSRYIQNFMKFRPLLGELVSRDIKTKYRRSFLGVLWTLLNPLFMMIILSFVFSNLFRGGIENFPVYVLSGQVIFNFYSESTSTAMTAIINNAPLLKKVYIPKYLFVISRILSSAINILASFSALILVMIVTRADLYITVIFAIVPIIFITIFSMGVGLILSALAVKFRDLVHLYSVFITALMYLTPVIYPMSMLSGRMRQIVLLNPITNILEMFRGVVLYNTMPTVAQVLLATAETAIALIIGLYVFYKSQDDFILNV